MDFVHAELAHYYVDKGGIFVIGRSLGGGVATSVISTLPAEQLEQIDGLVLENTFTSIEDMAHEIFGVLACMKGWILTNHWRNIDNVKDITLPIFYVTGRYDEIVPTQHTTRLYEASKKSAHLAYWINMDGTHNDTWDVNRDEYLAKLNTFMSESHELRASRQESAASSSNYNNEISDSTTPKKNQKVR